MKRGKKGIFIDTNKLSKILNVPVIETVARKKKTLKKLLEKINDVCVKNVCYKNNSNILVRNRYNENIEYCIQVLMDSLVKKIQDKQLARWVAIKLIEDNVTQLHEELFGEEDYTPSSTVQEISNDIAYETGYYE